MSNKWTLKCVYSLKLYSYYICRPTPHSGKAHTYPRSTLGAPGAWTFGSSLSVQSPSLLCVDQLAPLNSTL